MSMDLGEVAPRGGWRLHLVPICGAARSGALGRALSRSPRASDHPLTTSAPDVDGARHTDDDGRRLLGRPSSVHDPGQPLYVRAAALSARSKLMRARLSWAVVSG